MGRRSRTKGKVFERLVANLFRDLLGLEGEDRESIRRGQQGSKQHFAGVHEPDVMGVPGLWVETKHANKPTLDPWWRQAMEDASVAGLEPVVVLRVTGGPVLFMLRAELAEQWGASVNGFSLTPLPSARVRWERDVPRNNECRLLAGGVALGTWECFAAMWRSASLRG